MPKVTEGRRILTRHHCCFWDSQTCTFKVSHHTHQGCPVRNLERPGEPSLPSNSQEEEGPSHTAPGAGDCTSLRLQFFKQQCLPLKAVLIIRRHCT